MTRSKGSRAYEAVIFRIKELISEGTLRPGDRLPTERELEERLGVSRPVLREAFRVLESWGWISSRRGSGRYLRSLNQRKVMPSGRTLIDLERAVLIDICEARQILEIRIAALAAERATEADVQRLEALVREAYGEPPTDSDPDLHFHLALAEATHNFLLRDLISTQVSLLKGMQQKALLRPERWRLLCQEHRQIMEHVKARRSAEAAEAMRLHLADLYDGIMEIGQAELGEEEGNAHH
ncbi:MAG: FadR/GntR family transcriptional regulator [Bacillota bacterium]